jgi:hypothetical protein
MAANRKSKIRNRKWPDDKNSEEWRVISEEKKQRAMAEGPRPTIANRQSAIENGPMASMDQSQITNHKSKMVRHVAACPSWPDEE